MNILMVSFGNISKPSGYGTRVISELETVQKDSQYNVRLLAFDDITRIEENELSRLKTLGIQYRLETYCKTNVFLLLRDTCRAIKLIRKEIITGNYKTIHAQNTASAFLCVLATLLLSNVNIVLDLHGIIAEFAYRSRLAGRIFKYPCLYVIEKLVLTAVSSIICVSKPMEEYVRSRTGTKTSLVPCCVDTGKFGFEVTFRHQIREKLGVQDRLVLVYCGTLSAWSSPNQIISFFKLVKQECKNAFLLILSPHDEGFLHIVSQERDITTDDYHIESVSNQLVPNYLQAADIGLLFRDNSIVNKVAFPTKFGEYLASGLAVVASPGIGHTAEIIEEYSVGLVYDPLRSSLSSLVEEVSMNRIEVAARSLKAASTLSWAHHREVITNLYANFLLT